LTKLVILGRDGLINAYEGSAICGADSWQPLPGSLEAIARLNQAGYRVAVATNQPGLAQGLFDLDALNAIHHKFHDLLDRIGGHVDAINYCPHHPDAGCACRKPKPGMLLQLAERFGSDMRNVVVIGRADTDAPAASAAGARALLVRSVAHTGSAASFHSLADAVKALLQEAG
jgi:D-glycero-D-manno-heptose 1,7-bisphosphate phosphatase